MNLRPMVRLSPVSLASFSLGNRHAGNAVFQGHNRVYGTREGQLHGTAHLSCIFAGSHHCAECADVVITAAHVLAGGFCFLAFFFAFYVFLLVGFVNQVVQNAFCDGWRYRLPHK